jgi:hypothetical protein
MQRPDHQGSFPSDPQLPLNLYEKMDQVRLTILLAVFTPRHRCAAWFTYPESTSTFSNGTRTSAEQCRTALHGATMQPSVSTPSFITPINPLPNTLDVG